MWRWNRRDGRGWQCTCLVRESKVGGPCYPWDPAHRRFGWHVPQRDEQNIASFYRGAHTGNRHLHRHHHHPTRLGKSRDRSRDLPLGRARRLLVIAVTRPIKGWHLAVKLMIAYRGPTTGRFDRANIFFFGERKLLKFTIIQYFPVNITRFCLNLNF